MVTTGARSTESKDPAAPPVLEYCVHFRRGDYKRGPTYAGTYGFDWIEWKPNSANNKVTDFDELLKVMDKPLSNYVQCFDPGLPAIPAQPAAPATATTTATPATPFKPAIPPSYAAVGSDLKRFREQLHSGYYRCEVKGNDYYLPWCSMKSGQTIQLKLLVQHLNPKPVALQPTNLFRVIADASYLVTINAQPNTGPMSLVPTDKLVLDVTIECRHPSGETVLLVVDEDNDLVGGLTMAENLYVYELPVRVVYVLLGEASDSKLPLRDDLPGAPHPPRPLEAAHPKAADTLQKAFEALNFIDFVNERTLNQALIKCVLHSPPPLSFAPPRAPGTLAPAYCLLLDKDQLKADGFFKNGTLQKPNEFAGYCEQLANAAPGIGSFSGITLYVHELNMPPPATGASLYAVGTVFGVDAKTLNIYRVGLNAGKRTTIAHELSHVLGLAHAFPDTDDTQATEYGVAVEKTQKDLAAAQATLSRATQPADIRLRQQAVLGYTNSLNFLSARYAVYQQNAFKFTQYTTENIMDYDVGTADTRLSYWHWQWGIMQADVTAYYGTKTASV